MTDISIIILNYNTRDLLAQTLDSIKNSAHSGIEIETIVTDNGSVDDSIQLLQSRYPWVKVVENKANLGFSAGNNRGIPVSSGKYVLFLNSDIQVVDTAIAQVYAEMETDPQVGIGTCYVELASGGIDPACHRGFPTPWRACCYYLGLEKAVRLFPNTGFGHILRKWFGGYHLLERDLSLPHPIDACIGAFMMVRRNVGDAIHWWDEEFFMYGEDLDFCYKVSELGYTVMFYPASKIIHHKHQSGLKKSSLSADAIAIRTRTTNAFYDAMKIFYQKHYVKRYPFWLTGLVLWFVDLKRKRALAKIR